MLTTVILKRAETNLREACAWLLPGSDPRTWLEEVASWPVPMETLRFYPIAGLANAIPLGVLVVPGTAMQLPAGSRALPYGTVGPGFFLPIDGVLFPQPEPEELTALMYHPVWVFHPSVGLTGFEQADARYCWDLLLPPEQKDEPWNIACAVDLLNSRLRSVRLATSISLETLFGEQSKDIGSEPLVDLPPASNEPRFPLPGKIGLILLALFARGIMALGRLLPRTAQAPTWINHVEDWARRKFAGVSKNLEDQRHRELHRLLDMLEKNPSEALRYAISLAALAQRGRSKPSGKLGLRQLDFSLGRLGGNRPVDNWNIPADIQTNLAEGYRKAAHREATLGNYRRAACIFAELLGDFNGAAEMLKRGRYFQEAALLYRDRLHNQIAAAECLAEGGFLEEAVAIYEKLGRWLEIAAIHEKAGFIDRAKIALRHAVDGYIKAGDLLAAAHLLETRLGEPLEALALLASAWPRGKQALRSLEERFALLGRLHDHAGIRALLDDLGHQKLPSSTRSQLVGLLAQQFESLVAGENRQAAAEAARLHISTLLAERSLDSSEEIGVLRALTRLVPQDRLLKRDVVRFRESRIKVLPIQVTPAKSPSLIRRINLDKGVVISLPKVGKWLLVTGDEHGLHAVAQRGETNLFFTRGTWAGAMQSVEWTNSKTPDVSLFLLSGHDDHIILRQLLAGPLEFKKLPETDAFKTRNCHVGTPSWLPDDTVQIASAGSILWAVRVVGNRVVLASFSLGEGVYSRDVTDALQAAGATGHGTTLSLDARGGPGRVALGYGKHLLVMDGQRDIRLCELGGRVIKLLPAPASNPGWVALLDQGAVFVEAGTLVVTVLDEQMAMPQGTFMGDGHLVLISGEEGKVIRLEPGKVFPVAWFPFSQSEWLAMTATAHPREFAVFTADGMAQRWQIPV